MRGHQEFITSLVAHQLRWRHLHEHTDTVTGARTLESASVGAENIGSVREHPGFLACLVMILRQRHVGGRRFTHCPGTVSAVAPLDAAGSAGEDERRVVRGYRSRPRRRSRPI